MFMRMREGNTLLVQSLAVMKDSSVKKASLDLYNARSRSIILRYAKFCPVLLLHYVCGIPTGVQHRWPANEINCRSKIVNYHRCSVCKIWEVGKRSDACFFRAPLEQPDTVRVRTASSGTQTVSGCGRHSTATSCG